MIVVAVVVVALAGFAVDRLHGAFGSDNNVAHGSGISDEIVPVQPKQVVYEIFGAPGATATINYLDCMPSRSGSRTRRCRGRSR